MEIDRGGARPCKGAAWGLSREGEDGRGPSGRGADDGAWSTMAPARWRGGSGMVDGEQGREESVRERELGEGERRELRLL
jgi:hypothetical protein